MSTTKRKKSGHTNVGPQYANQNHSAAGMQPAKDAVDYVRAYARQKPDVAALWCFGLGVVVGWKIKPW